MFEPRFEEVLRLSRTHNLIPIRLSMMADQETPIRLFQKYQKEAAFLLESVEGTKHWSRYSFIGLTPFLRVKATEQEVELQYATGERERLSANPIEVLRRLCRAYQTPQLPDFPPLTGGAVGYLGYNTLRNVEERLPKHKRQSLQIPDVQILFVDEMLVYDHVKQEIQFFVHVKIAPDDTEDIVRTKYQEATERLLELQKQSEGEGEQIQRAPIITQDHKPLVLTGNMTYKEYESMINKGKEYIASGDIFQIVLSQRLSAETSVDPFAVYRVLRTTNPSPYLYYLPLESATLVGASPEVVVKVQDKQVQIRPIAGTRKRGSTKEEDMALEQELLADEKELAEHHMLVDLARNDVGRVCNYASVNVDQMLEIERYSQVMHISSTVSGVLKDNMDCFDALLSAFPAGTVSGAPKIRAMELIAELEQDDRHTYAGAICYFSFTGNLDSCIAIRTLLFTEGKVHMQSGGGIVADSIPELEYQEALNKAKAMIKALEKAEKMFTKKEAGVC
ncbi:anthranilate synthase component I [Brevibacillus daliensis]|uniref:anthranilate synthase component I n=1 Tax=Brevibacillus daliensis TaxID=2892995 RepID=UPI001E541E7E|nr:anthranilate synthase component I [Brevibacillus daliensis]